MRVNLEALVKSSLEREGLDRIILFVDDIDRLVPERAVDLLEAMKVFLDVEGCVFVLACDYHVISRGLKAKFGTDSSDLKGKHFFDKIIQLPFSMPTGNLRVAGYLRQQLSACGVALSDVPDSRLAIYESLLAHSVGFNPRSLPRLVNSFRVLRHVAMEKRIFDVSPGVGAREDRERALFAVLCLQTAYEPIYHALVQLCRQRGESVAELIESLKDVSESEPEDGEQQFNQLIDAAIDETNQLRPGASREIGDFFSALSRALRTGGDAQVELLPAEVEIFNGFLRLATITSTTASAVEVAPSQGLSNVRPLLEELRDWIGQFLVCGMLRTPEWFEDEDGIWCSPRIPHLGFGMFIGFTSDGGLCVSVDVTSDKKAKAARAKAKQWCQEALQDIDPAIKPAIKSRGDARYGLVSVQLEGPGFSSGPIGAVREGLFGHAERLFMPMVVGVVERFEAQRSRPSVWLD